MKPQGQHAMLPQQTYDEAARESCIASMRRFFTTELIPGNRELYQARLLPQFTAEHGREPANPEEIRALLDATFHYRGSSLIGRATQELLWDTVGESIERQLDALIERAQPKAGSKGTLQLDPDLRIPAYIDTVDIHCMPGNFHTQLCEGDLLAGALYDRGAYVFAYGGRGAYNENLGRLAAGLLKKRFPDFKPQRILEMGCGCGVSTLPLKEAWPDAEVYAVDVAAPMLRYAHARAEALGVPIHFSQQDATASAFHDGNFDLVLSFLVHHEMPLPVIQKMIAESYRVLAPGGVMLHDGALRGDRPPPDAYQQFMSGWFARNINEPFGKGFDAERDFQGAGFRREDIFSDCPEGDDYLKGQLASHSYVGACKR